ncbi:photosystem II reaction center PSB28 protein, chloroplastic isoform X1 [Aegilops tauschii subsp. strangulata]
MDGCGWNTGPPNRSCHHLPPLHHSKPHPLPSSLCASLPPFLAQPAMEALAVASPAAARPQPRRRRLAAGSCSSCQRRTSQLHTSFSGVTVQLQKPLHPTTSSRRSSSVVAMAMTSRPSIQFIQGTDEQTIPDVRLTKSRDGSNGVAIFTFEQPSVFDSSAELGDITGFYMIDEEGTLSSVDVSAKFVNGKPAAVEAKYVMRTPRDWDRFMRFMERYSQANGLQFLKK